MTKGTVEESFQWLICYQNVQQNVRADMIDGRLSRMGTSCTSAELKNFHPNSFVQPISR
jgi:hypothetical protein